MGILDQIASGGTANPVGSYLQGQQVKRAATLSDLQTKMTQEKLAAIQAQREQEANRQKIVKTADTTKPNWAMGISKALLSSGDVQGAKDYAQIGSVYQQANAQQRKEIDQRHASFIADGGSASQAVLSALKVSPEEGRKAYTQIYQEMIQKYPMLAKGMPPPDADINQIASVANNFLNRSMKVETYLNKEKYAYELKNLDAQTKKLDADAKIALIKLKQLQESGGASKEQIFQAENKLKQQFTKESSDFVKIRDAYGRIKASAENPSAAGDLAMIFNYMKLLDPTSVVRESEFATAQNAAGVPARIRAWFNRVKSGERLSKKTRDDFLNRSDKLYKKQYSFQKKLEDSYTNIAKRYNLNPANIVQKYDAFGMNKQESPTYGTPPPGAVKRLP